MDTPKISVLIPMYNRKHYIEQCIDSVLTQTFQDFEIIIRDDGSTDGSADFVEKIYAPAISSGKLKLCRNKKNIGEFPTDNRLLREATGKYVMILHSDDLYLPEALEQMYITAEKFNADIVHSSIHLTTAPDGIIQDGTRLKIFYHDEPKVNKTEIIPNDPLSRLNAWLNGEIFIDAQYNIFNRKFLTDNDLFFSKGGNRFFALKWIMKAKVLVKVPELFYIYRNSPDSVTNVNFPPERVKGFISSQIELSRYLDEFFARDDFFKNKPEMQYLVRSNLFIRFDNHRMLRNNVYKDGITPELNKAVEDAFKKYLGTDAAYPAFLFHWIHATTFSQRADMLAVSPQQIDF